MIRKIRNSYSVRVVSAVLALQIFITTIDFSPVYAGDGTPTLPEVQSFEPVATNQMVDLFTGDFTYNIPLFNLPGPDGGYPVNLAYHSGVMMEQEATWVGLGWNINMGTINRQVRNLPDDFGGKYENLSEDQELRIKSDMRPHWTVGASGKKTIETWGINQENIGVGVAAGVKLFYNNYKGIGYSLDVNLSIDRGCNSGIKGIEGDLGLEFGLNSQEGINSKYSLSFSESVGGTNANQSVSTGFNTRSGWSRDVTISAAYQKNSFAKRNNHAVKEYQRSGGTTISFANTYANMNIPHAMKGTNFSFTFSSGWEGFGLLSKMPYAAFYNESRILYDTELPYQAIGYMYYQNTIDDYQPIYNDFRVKDVSRENDGLIHKHTKRLATPTLSYDIYSVTGQGIGNMFRPYRNDIGVSRPQKVNSEYYGGNFAFEKPKTFTGKWIGIDIGFNYAHQRQDLWPNSNNAVKNHVFGSSAPLSLAESVYFQNYGEQTADDLVLNYGSSVASEKPVTYMLDPENHFYDVLNKDYNSKDANNQNTEIDIVHSRTARKKRAQDVEPFTNGLLMNQNRTQTVIPEFRIKYYQSISGSQGYNPSLLADYDLLRKDLPTSHVGGYSALNEAGMRYIYALPAINNEEKDVTFSVEETVNDLNSTTKALSLINNDTEIDYKKKGTNMYYNSVKKGKYAHSYLLTSVLGDDYVDADSEAGPSNGDLGYWVRMDYVQAHSDYKWRAPYSGSAYNKGFETSFSDGTGSYSSGNKEVWYVATVQTKTHVAEFILSDRKDALEPAGELGTSTQSKRYKKLDKINIYVKSERYNADGSLNTNARPIQTCNFVYDYSLCTGIPDNNGSSSGIPNANELSNQGGKLTLKKVYFTYRNNQSGKSRPYKFEYGTNAPYERSNVDRWGNYKPGGAANIDYPYIDPMESAAAINDRAATWNLSAIDLPSGGRYAVEYESDTYGYVQNEVAMQMFKIKSMDPYSMPLSAHMNHGKNGLATDRRVYFVLETGISQNDSEADRRAKMQRYIKQGEYIYFKVKTNMTKDNSSTEYVGGYVKVNDIDVDLTSAVNGVYQWGCVELDKMKVNGEMTEFHPFTEAGARHLKYNQADLLYDNPPNADKEKLSKSEIRNVGWSLISNVTDIKDIFMDFTNMIYSGGNGRCTHIDLDKSYLRMRTPDKVKFGGGHRVKKVTVYDNWDTFGTGGEAGSSYSTVYDYNMKDPVTGEMISSGVAAYEPMVGGDEIALRKPVKGWEDKSVASKTQALTYDEDPGNESLYPGPTVGYRQVRVMSGVTAEKISNTNSTTVNYTGITEHHFYTALDYPVISKCSDLEQNKTLQKSRLYVPALLVNIDRVRMAATQGYYIELNDMHGKPDYSREIGFDAQGKEEEISKVQYSYFDETYYTTNDAGEKLLTRKLKNQVNVITSDIKASNPQQADFGLATLATEVEFVPEQRYFENKSVSGGLDLNFKVAPALFVAIPIPNFNWNVEKTGTVVTNKIVNKTGIIKSVEATQRGATISTENLLFDDMTGQPLLTSVTNEYGDKIYNYSVLARDKYDLGVGASYKNIGLTVNGTMTGSLSTGGIQQVTITDALVNQFVPGDVLLATPMNGIVEDGTRPEIICVFNSRVGTTNNYKLETKISQLTGVYRFTIIRSGRRNLLTMPVSNIVAMADPTINRQVTACTKAGEYTSENYFINNVLAINAVELGHHWYKDNRQLATGTFNAWGDEMYFSKGFGGIYAPVRSYYYQDTRTQTSSPGVNLKYDGVFNNVMLFNWKNTQNYCVNKWRLNEQVTLKNPSSFDIESKNVLGVYSSKLFGRYGTQPIAVAANAKNTEIGVENFEEYATGGVNLSANASNNLNFYTVPDVTGVKVEDRYDVTNGLGTVGTVDIPVSYLNGSALTGYTSYVLRMHWDANGAVPAKEELVKLTVAPTFALQSGKIQLTLPSLTDAAYAGNRWRGELFATKTIPTIQSTPGLANVRIVNGIAHTGKQAMAITGTTSHPIFLQGKLTLVPGEQYQFTGWFSTSDNKSLLLTKNRIFSTDMQLRFYDAGGTLLSTQTFTEDQALQGGFIENWQKFALNFTMPAGAAYVSVMLPATHSGITEVYYDDLRMQPLDGGMQTYVYNKDNQRLDAVLDGNNYATFYYYDDQGNLFLVKQETEKGIITQQESRSFLKKTE